MHGEFLCESYPKISMLSRQVSVFDGTVQRKFSFVMQEVGCQAERQGVWTSCVRFVINTSTLCNQIIWVTLGVMIIAAVANINDSNILKLCHNKYVISSLLKKCIC